MLGGGSQGDEGQPPLQWGLIQDTGTLLAFLTAAWCSGAPVARLLPPAACLTTGCASSLTWLPHFSEPVLSLPQPISSSHLSSPFPLTPLIPALPPAYADAGGAGIRPRKRRRAVPGAGAAPLCLAAQRRRCVRHHLLSCLPAWTVVCLLSCPDQAISYMPASILTCLHPASSPLPRHSVAPHFKRNLCRRCRPRRKPEGHSRPAPAAGAHVQPRCRHSAGGGTLPAQGGPSPPRRCCGCASS